MADKKKKDDVFSYLSAMLMPTPEHEKNRKTMEESQGTEVDRQGNVIPKKRLR